MAELEVDEMMRDEIVKLAHALNVQPADVVNAAVIRFQELDEVKKLMQLSGAIDGFRKTILRTK